MDEYRYGHMLQEYFVSTMRGCSAARAEARRQVRTREEVLALRAQVRRKLRACFGPLPARTPLNAQVIGVVDRKEFRIEKVFFESRPGFPVTANLYVPACAGGPMPAVLIPCGHDPDGKASPCYQTLCRQFARMGYVALVYDPVSQGEREQYPEYRNRPPVQGACQEHNMMGNQMSLVGQFFGLWRLWDGIRAMDYLLSRTEVDRRRVAVTGASGGGTLSMYLSAFDDRFAAVAPVCHVTTYLHNLENELAADSESMPPAVAAVGLNHADFFLAQIPRPTLLMGQDNDFFDQRGLEETYGELRRLYGIFGKADDVQLAVAPGVHDYSLENRQRVYRFFNRVTGVRASVSEPVRDQTEPAKTLQVTPKGQVHFLKPRRVFDFTAETARALALARPPLAGAALTKAIERRLQLPARRGVPYYRVLRCVGFTEGKHQRIHNTFAVETEPGIVALLHAFPEKGYLFHVPAARDATIYVPHQSSREEFDKGLAPAASPVAFAIDPRGIGQLRARACDNDEDFFSIFAPDYFYASNALMMNASYAGRRVYDVLRVLDLLEALGYQRVHLVGRGLGALTATFAACLHPLVRRVTLHNTLLSFHELTQTPVQRWPLSAMPFGVLRDFDLPDCYRWLQAKRLRLVAPWDAQMRSRRRPARAASASR